MAKPSIKKVLGALFLAFVSSCSTEVPEGVSVVDGFDAKRYTGTWYEIARLDHRFERGLEKISATYTLRDDGDIDVLNQGWTPESGEWKKAEGLASFVGASDKGSLKVSFFGPFYGGYHIIALDKQNYSYSMVTGPDKSYFWILSRIKTLPKATLDGLLAQAKQQGFATDQLIFVKQE
ncbi:lipocalin family protein [Methylosoma difficile]